MNNYTQSILLIVFIIIFSGFGNSGCSEAPNMMPDADMGVMNGDMDVTVPDMGDDANVLPDMDVTVDAGMDMGSDNDASTNQDAGMDTDMGIVVEDAGVTPDAAVDMGTTVDAGSGFVETVVPAGEYFWVWFPESAWTNTENAVAFCDNEGGFYIESTTNLFSDIPNVQNTKTWTLVNNAVSTSRGTVDALLDTMCVHTNLLACQTWCNNTFGCNPVTECMSADCTERFSYAQDAMFMSSEFNDHIIKQNGSNIGQPSTTPDIICLMPSDIMSSFVELPHAHSVQYSN